jgi:hypothetical protein
MPREDTLKLRLGVAPIGLRPVVPRVCRTRPFEGARQKSGGATLPTLVRESAVWSSAFRRVKIVPTAFETPGVMEEESAAPQDRSNPPKGGTPNGVPAGFLTRRATILSYIPVRGGRSRGLPLGAGRLYCTGVVKWSCGKTVAVVRRSFP